MLTIHLKLPPISSSVAISITPVPIKPIVSQVTDILLPTAPNELPVAIHDIRAPLTHVPAPVPKVALAKAVSLALLHAPSVVLAVGEDHAAAAGEIRDVAEGATTTFGFTAERAGGGARVNRLFM